MVRPHAARAVIARYVGSLAFASLVPLMTAWPSALHAQDGTANTSPGAAPGPRAPGRVNPFGALGSFGSRLPPGPRSVRPTPTPPPVAQESDSASEPAPVAAPVVAPGAGPDFILSGVVIVSDEDQRALLAEAALTEGHPRMLRKGEQIGSFSLVRVLPDRVVLRSGDQELMVPLARGEARASQPPAPVAAAPAPARRAEPPPGEVEPPGRRSGEAFQNALKGLRDKLRPRDRE